MSVDTQVALGLITLGVLAAVGGIAIWHAPISAFGGLLLILAGLGLLLIGAQERGYRQIRAEQMLCGYNYSGRYEEIRTDVWCDEVVEPR